MDNFAFHQRLSALVCAFSAGLLTRPDVPAPHIHFPASECPAPEAPSTTGWSSWAIVVALFLGYVAGVAWPPLACLRALARRLARLGGEPPAGRSPRRAAGQRLRDQPAGARAEPPRALFSD